MWAQRDIKDIFFILVTLFMMIFLNHFQSSIRVVCYRAGKLSEGDSSILCVWSGGGS